MWTPADMRASMSFDRPLMDDVVDAYVDWREQCGRVWLAYHAWSCAAPRDGRLRFAAYLAELDQEHRTTEAYAAMIARLSAGKRAAGCLPPTSGGLSRTA
jgi:hypothetical protein